MTMIQMDTFNRYGSFLNNIGKLSKGRSAKFATMNTDYGTVTCATIGERPRKFNVSGSSVVPNGQYTYRTLLRYLINRVG